jgi:hypothetical protein
MILKSGCSSIIVLITKLWYNWCYETSNNYKEWEIAPNHNLYPNEENFYDPISPQRNTWPEESLLSHSSLGFAVVDLDYHYMGFYWAMWKVSLSNCSLSCYIWHNPRTLRYQKNIMCQTESCVCMYSCLGAASDGNGHSRIVKTFVFIWIF